VFILISSIDSSPPPPVAASGLVVIIDSFIKLAIPDIKLGFCVISNNSFLVIVFAPTFATIPPPTK
jgi:hypothetical protein